jgi:hypothetical protein
LRFFLRLVELLPDAAIREAVCNKPLMIRSRHWKSRRVLPTFQHHPSALVGGFPAMRAQMRRGISAWNCRYG